MRKANYIPSQRNVPLPYRPSQSYSRKKVKTMKKEYKYEVDTLAMDDSDGCYITVTLPGLDDKGY